MFVGTTSKEIDGTKFEKILRDKFSCRFTFSSTRVPRSRVVGEELVEGSVHLIFIRIARESSEILK